MKYLNFVFILSISFHFPCMYAAFFLTERIYKESECKKYEYKEEKRKYCNLINIDIERFKQLPFFNESKDFHFKIKIKDDSTITLYDSYEQEEYLCLEHNNQTRCLKDECQSIKLVTYPVITMSKKICADYQKRFVFVLYAMVQDTLHSSYEFKSLYKESFNVDFYEKQYKKMSLIRNIFFGAIGLQGSLTMIFFLLHRDDFSCFQNHYYVGLMSLLIGGAIVCDRLYLKYYHKALECLNTKQYLKNNEVQKTKELLFSIPKSEELKTVYESLIVESKIHNEY